MKPALYTKAVLTIIAACLVWLCLDRSALLPTVSAQSNNQVYIAGWVEAGVFRSPGFSPVLKTDKSSDSIRDAGRHADHLGAELGFHVVKGEHMKGIRTAGMAGTILAMAVAAHAQGVAQTQVTPVAPVRQAPDVRVLTVPAQETKRIQGFSVALLLGEAQGSATPDGLSAPARKALTDLNEFLPYKGYRVLDTQWIAGTERVPSMQVRLRGPDNQDYIVSMGSQPIDAATAISATVGLSTPSMSDATRAQAMERITQLENVTPSPGRNVAETQRELAQLKRAVAGGQELIRTTLRINPGETVVVGTSRVQGDKALIVLLTAVPR